MATSGTKTRNPVWSYYRTLDGAAIGRRGPAAECSFCLQIFAGVPSRMVDHVVSRCRSAPDDVKMKLSSYSRRRTPRNSLDQGMVGQGDAAVGLLSTYYSPEKIEDLTMVVGDGRAESMGYTADSLDMPTVLREDCMDTKCVQFHTPPNLHQRKSCSYDSASFDNTPSTVGRVSPVAVATTETNSTDGMAGITDFTKAVSRFVFGCGLSANIVQNRHFIRFVEQFGSGVTLPSKSALSSVMLDDCCRGIEAEIENCLKDASSIALTVRSFSRPSGDLVICYVTLQPTVLLLNNIIYEAGSCTASDVAAKTTDIIEKLGAKRIASVLVDHCGLVKEAWDLVGVKYPWIWHSACVLDVVESIVADVAAQIFDQRLIFSSINIFQVFLGVTVDAEASGHLESILNSECSGGSGGVGGSPCGQGLARWECLASALDNLLVNCQQIQQAARDDKFRSMFTRQESVDAIYNDNFWTALTEYVAILAPLMKLMRRAQHAPIRVHDARGLYTSLGAELLALNASLRAGELLREIIERRVGPWRRGCVDLAHLLHPVHRGQYLSREELDRTLKYLMDYVAIYLGYGDALGKAVAAQVVNFIGRSANFDSPVMDNLATAVMPAAWWRAQNVDACETDSRKPMQVLKELASKLMSLPASSVWARQRPNSVDLLLDRTASRSILGPGGAVSKKLVYAHENLKLLAGDLATVPHPRFIDSFLA